MREFIKDENSGKEVGIFWHNEQVRKDTVYLGYYIETSTICGDSKCAMLESEEPTSMDKFEFRFNKDKFGRWKK